MTNHKTAIATIATDAGTMTIYYNGANEPMTAETSDLIEEIDCAPENLSVACDYVYASYSIPGWDLEMFDL